MHLDWSKKIKVTIDKLTETLPADALDRAKYAEYLTHFLIGKGQITEKKKDGDHYVLNLNAEWGAGKSYFLKRWAEDLKTEHPVVYIDAWQQDYSDDPLLTAVSAMINQLRVQAGKDADKTIFKAPRKMLGLLKAAAPAAIAGIVKRYAGFDFQEIMQAADKGENLGLVEDTHNGNQQLDMSKAASAMVQSLLDDHDAKTQAITALKHQVRQWVGAVIGKHANSDHQKDYPAFILVDELDRCRPSYAVEMLETIKHIFDIPGVVFVVATDTEQLQHTVKALYGEGFDARAYLGRFFNSRYTLKTPSLEKLLPVHCEVHKLSQQYLESKGIISWPDLDYPPEANGQPEKSNLKNLIAVFDAFELNARLALQVTERLISATSGLKQNEKINLVYLAFLMCLRELRPDLYFLLLKNPIDAQIPHNNNSSVLADLVKKMHIFSNKRIIFFALRESKLVPVVNNSAHNPIALYGTLRDFIVAAHTHLFCPDPYNPSKLPLEHELKTIREIESFKNLALLYVAEFNDRINSIDFYSDLVELSACLDSGDAE